MACLTLLDKGYKVNYNKLDCDLLGEAERTNKRKEKKTKQFFLPRVQVQKD